MLRKKIFVWWLMYAECINEHLDMITEINQVEYGVYTLNASSITHN
ncbi:hypothetical protein [Shimia sp. SK013]|nr:hypothetical protein [Shimia sp. SK013]